MNILEFVQSIDTEAIKTYIPIILLGVLFFGIAVVCVRFIALRFTTRRKTVTLEITPPLTADVTPESMEQFFRMLHTTISGNKPSFSGFSPDHITIEMTATKSTGIRFLVTVSDQLAAAIERAISAMMRDASIKRVDEARQQYRFSKIISLKQTKHFALPLRVSNSFLTNDSTTYMIGAMNQLEDDESVSMQLVITPARIRNMAGIVTRYREYYNVSDAIHNKAYGYLFNTELRVRSVGSNKRAVYKRMRELVATLQVFSIPKVQSLRPMNIVSLLLPKVLLWQFDYKLPALFRRSNVFSSLELANLYHFPAHGASMDSVIVAHSRTLPPPLSLVNATDLDVLLGKNVHRGVTTNIGLTAKEREKHVFIVGGTGNGKTTLLEYAIKQDIENGKGVAVVDPHGDLAESLLSHVPEERVNDVIYFNPDDIVHPIGLNVLELTPGLSKIDALREKELVAESVISIFRKIFSEHDDGGHRIEYILRNTIYTAFYVKDATLFTVYNLLNDNDFRKDVVRHIEDNKELHDFWNNEMGKAGKMQEVKLSFGVTAKIGRFLFSESAKRVLGQSRSTINFDNILNGKILLCNFSKGLLGEDTSELFGITVLAKLQIAALRRARISEIDRKPFYLYVDEFQNFATPSFTQMLSEARKYKLFLTMAEQTTSQQSDRSMTDIILANVGTVVCFRSGNPMDETRLLPYFNPYLKAGDIPSLASFTFFIRISASRIQEVFSGETVVPKAGVKNVINKNVSIQAQDNSETKFNIVDSNHTTKVFLKTPGEAKR